MAPNFRTGDYDEGMEAALSSIMNATRNAYKGDGQTAAEKHREHQNTHHWEYHNRGRAGQIWRWYRSVEACITQAENELHEPSMHFHADRVLDEAQQDLD
jgi:uncharacterized membrane protein YgcG